METKTSNWLTKGISPKQLKKEKKQALKEFRKLNLRTNKKKLEPGIVKEFKDKTILWYGLVTEEDYAFTLRNEENKILNRWYQAPPATEEDSATARLLKIVAELDAREISFNLVVSELRDKTWSELCDEAIVILEQLKVKG